MLCLTKYSLLHPVCSDTTQPTATQGGPCCRRPSKNTAASAQGLVSKFPQKGCTAHPVSSVHWNLVVLCPFPALSHPVTWMPVRTALSGTHRTLVKTPSTLSEATLHRTVVDEAMGSSSSLHFPVFLLTANRPLCPALPQVQQTHLNPTARNCLGHSWEPVSSD